jgi:hypothetical protein
VREAQALPAAQHEALKLAIKQRGANQVAREMNTTPGSLFKIMANGRGYNTTHWKVQKWFLRYAGETADEFAQQVNLAVQILSSAGYTILPPVTE